MPRTLGLLIAVLIIALLGALAITLNDNTGLRFYLDGVFQGESESLDIHKGHGIDVIAHSSPDQTDYTISTHLGASIGGSAIGHSSGTGPAVADTIDLESPDGSLKITATHVVTSVGKNVIEFDLNDAAIDFALDGTTLTTTYDKTASAGTTGPRSALNLKSSDSSLTIVADAYGTAAYFEYDIVDAGDGIEFFVSATPVPSAGGVFDELNIEAGGSGNVSVSAAESSGRVTYTIEAVQDDTIGFSLDGGTESAHDALDIDQGAGISVTFTPGATAQDPANYVISADPLGFTEDGTVSGRLTAYNLDLNEGSGIDISMDNTSVPGAVSYTISSPGAVDFKDSAHSVSLDDRDAVDILAGSGISVALTDPSGVATYTIAAVGGVSGNTEFKSGTQTKKVGHTVDLNAAADSGLDIVLTQPATNEVLYEFVVDESDLDRTTIAAGAGITVTAGTPDATTKAIDYIISDPTISFFLGGTDSRQDRAGIDLVAGTDIAITQNAHNDRFAYTIDFSGQTGADIDFNSGTQTAVTDAAEVDIDSATGSGIDISLTEPTPDDALYSISVDQDELARTSVSAASGSGVTVTAGTANATTGVRDYALALGGIDFWLGGTNLNLERPGIEMVGGTDISITSATHTDRVAFTIDYSGTTGADIDFNSGTQTAVTDAAEVDIDSATGSGIDIALSQPTTGEALYGLSVDQDELARTTVSAASGSGITVTGGAANATTGVRDYALTLGGIDFWLGGTNLNLERPGIELVGGTDIAITSTTHNDRVAYAIAFSGSTSGGASIDFNSGGQTAVTSATEVDIDSATGSGIDIALSQPTTGEALYGLSVDQDELARTTVTAGTGMTVTAGTANATTGVRNYTIADAGDDISFFLGGNDTNIDAGGVGIRAGTGITLTGSAQTGHYEYTIAATGGASGNVTFGHAGSSDVISAAADVEEGHGIDLTLANTSGVATYTVVVDESDLDRTEVSAGNAIDVTAGNANSAGVIGYAVAVDESDLSRTTVVAGSGVTVTAGNANSDGAIAYTVADPTDAISFFRNGSDLNVDRDGIDLVPGSNVTITTTEHSDRVAYTINSAAPTGSTDITFKTNGSGSDVTEDAVSLSSNTDSGIDISLTETSNVATYSLSVDESELDRTTVTAGSGITVVTGAADATTGARNYTVTDAGDDISFYLGGNDTNIDAEGVGLRAGTGVAITGSSQTGRYEYTISTSGATTANVTFGHAGASDVISDEADVQEAHGIDVTLASNGGVATYTVSVDESNLDRTQVLAGNAIDVTAGNVNPAGVRGYTVSVDESDLDRTEVQAGNAIDVTAGNPNSAGVIGYAVAVDESDLSRTTVVAGSGVTVTAGTANSDGAIAYTVADVGDTIEFSRNGTAVGSKSQMDLIAGTGVTVSTTTTADRVLYTIDNNFTGMNLQDPDGSSGNIVNSDTILLRPNPSQPGINVDLDNPGAGGVARYSIGLDVNAIPANAIQSEFNAYIGSNLFGAGSSIRMTEGNAIDLTGNDLGSIEEFIIAVDESDIDKPAVIEGNGVDITTAANGAATDYTVTVDPSEIVLTEAQAKSDTSTVSGAVTGKLLADSVVQHQRPNVLGIPQVSTIPTVQGEELIYLTHDYTEGVADERTITVGNDNFGRYGYSSGRIIDQFGSVNGNIGTVHSIYGFGTSLTDYTIRLIHSSSEQLLTSLDSIRINGTSYSLDSVRREYGIFVRDLTTYPSLTAATFTFNLHQTGADANQFLFNDGTTKVVPAGLYEWNERVDEYARLVSEAEGIPVDIWSPASLDLDEDVWLSTGEAITALRTTNDYDIIRVQGDGHHVDVELDEIVVLANGTAGQAVANGQYIASITHTFGETPPQNITVVYLGTDGTNLLVAFDKEHAVEPAFADLYGVD